MMIFRGRFYAWLLASLEYLDGGLEFMDQLQTTSRNYVNTSIPRLSVPSDAQCAILTTISGSCNAHDHLLDRTFDL